MSGDNESATADRVEKKSIDEAIASFAMLVRRIFIYVLCLYEWEERRISRQPFFFFFYFFGDDDDDVLCLTFGKSSALCINALIKVFWPLSDLFLCSLSVCYVLKKLGGDVYVQRVHHRLVPHSEIQLDVFTTVGSVFMHRDDLWSDNQFHHAR